MGLLVAGNIAGALTSSFVIMMLSRIIEGVSYAMIIMIGIELINRWFVTGGAATATGILNSFFPVGAFLMMNMSLPLVQRFGISSLWWLVAALAVLSMILIHFFMEVPEYAAADSTQAVSLSEALRNRSVLVLSAVIGCMTFILLA